QVREALGGHPEWAGLTGRSVDAAGRASNGRWSSRAGVLTARNLWTRSVSYTMFLRRSLLDAVGAFDETLGLGAGTSWAAAEDYHSLLRALGAGCALAYDPSLVVHHPPKREQLARPDPAVGYQHAQGMGRVLRKSRAPMWFVTYHWTRPIGAGLLALLRG